MESKIAEAIRLQLKPVAVLFSDEKPDGAMQFAEGKWGCVMWLLASAAKGKAAVADRSTFGCIGGGTGIGFGNQYENWQGGIECFYRFLSTGNEDWAHGRSEAEKFARFARREFVEHYLHGERYIKTPELTKRFVAALPIFEVPTRYVVFKPLSEVAADERPEVVVFFVDPDRLSALIVLANYGRGDNDNVTIPWAAGCQSVGIYAYKETRSEKPRAVVGLTDLSARVYIAKQLGPNLMTFAVPFVMLEEMEANVAGSFLERHTWHSLIGETES
jgi:uncharacterized protein (DUF169 family)